MRIDKVRFLCILVSVVIIFTSASVGPAAADPNPPTGSPPVIVSCTYPYTLVKNFPNAYAVFWVTAVGADVVEISLAGASYQMIPYPGNLYYFAIPSHTLAPGLYWPQIVARNQYGATSESYAHFLNVCWEYEGGDDFLSFDKTSYSLDGWYGWDATDRTLDDDACYGHHSVIFLDCWIERNYPAASDGTFEIWLRTGTYHCWGALYLQESSDSDHWVCINFIKNFYIGYGVYIYPNGAWRIDSYDGRSYVIDATSSTDASRDWCRVKIVFDHYFELDIFRHQRFRLYVNDQYIDCVALTDFFPVMNGFDVRNVHLAERGYWSAWDSPTAHWASSANIQNTQAWNSPVWDVNYPGTLDGYPQTQATLRGEYPLEDPTIMTNTQVCKLSKTSDPNLYSSSIESTTIPGYYPYWGYGLRFGTACMLQKYRYVSDDDTSPPIISEIDINNAILGANTFTVDAKIYDPGSGVGTSGIGYANARFLGNGYPMTSLGSNNWRAVIRIPLTITSPSEQYTLTITTSDSDSDYIGDALSTESSTSFSFRYIGPVANDDCYAVDEDMVLLVDAESGVLANDRDVCGTPFLPELVSGPCHGTLIFNLDGSFSYTPAKDFNGMDSFVYAVSDGVSVNSGTVAITVNPVNDAPVATTRSYTIDEDTLLTVATAGGLAHDADVDGDPLEVVLDSLPLHGVLTLNPDGSFTYAPYPNLYGNDLFCYHLNDGLVDSNVAKVWIIVNPVNDAPVAEDDTFTTAEDVGFAFEASSLLANDADVEGDRLTIRIVSLPRFGSLYYVFPYGFTYRPHLNFNGVDTFVYEVSDGVLTDFGVVTIVVTPVDDAPVAVGDGYTMDEDGELALFPLENDYDVDGDIHEFNYRCELVTGPSHGEVYVVDEYARALLYVPDPNWFGEDSFTYRVIDVTLGSRGNIATITITVRPVEDPMVAVDDHVTTAEDTPILIDVLANDYDVDGDAFILVYVYAGPETHGLVGWQAGRTMIQYTPDANWYGTAWFEYLIAYEVGGVPWSRGYVYVTVAPVNDAPVAVDDSYTVDEDGALWVDPPGVLANDFDVEGPVQAVLYWLNGPLHAAVFMLREEGGFHYEPVPNFFGVDTFSYVISDGTSEAIATVTITVTPVNDPPVAADDVFTTQEDLLLVICYKILENDYDADGFVVPNSLWEVGWDYTQPAHGQLWYDPWSGFFYQPAIDFYGSDSFTYTIRDEWSSDTATVTITVEPLPDAPVANDDAYTIREDELLVVFPLQNDYDADELSGDPLILMMGRYLVVVVTGPCHCAEFYLVEDMCQAFSYTPAPNFFGVDTFTYQVFDGELWSNLATVTITVEPVNDPPVANDDEWRTLEDTPPAYYTDVFANDYDADGPFGVAFFLWDYTQPAHGVVEYDTRGFIYWPARDFYGVDSFTYTLADAFLGGLHDTATVWITVEPFPDLPVANDDAYTIREDELLVVFPLQNDYDADELSGDPLILMMGRYLVVVVTGPCHCAEFYLVEDMCQAFSYTPAPNFFGVDTFTYQVFDGELWSNLATVTITVEPVNDPPVAEDDGYTMEAGTTLLVPVDGVLGNDTDVDGDALVAILDTRLSHGLLVLSGDGSFSYTPDFGFFGVDAFTYHASDGVLASDTVTVTIMVVDTVPPETRIEPTGDVGSHGWYVSPVIIALSAMDAHTMVAETYYSLNEGAWYVYAGPFMLSGEGNYTVAYYSQDIAGNVEDAKTRKFGIDRTPPSTILIQRYKEGLNQGWWIWTPADPFGVRFEVNGVEPPQSGLHATSYSFDNVVWYEYTDGWVLFPGEGIYTIYYRSTDMAGNTETTKTKIIRLDGTLPTGEVFLDGTLGTNGWYLSDVEVTIVGCDVPSGVFLSFYTINGGERIDNTGPFTISAEGITTIFWCVMDKAGFFTTGTFTVNIDKTPPQTIILVDPPWYHIWYGEASVSCQLYTLEKTSSFVGRYRIDGGSWATFVNGSIITVSGEGSHLLEYYATDLAGNIEALHSHPTGIDVTPPTVCSLSSGTPGTNEWWLTPVQVTLVALDPDSGVAGLIYWVNGIRYDAFVDGSEIVLDTEGIHTVSWEAWDHMPWTTTGSITVKIDLAEPETTLTFSQVAGVGSIVTLSSTDSMSDEVQIAYSLDGMTWIPYETPFTLSVGGIVPVYFNGTDAAGWRESPHIRMVPVDVQPPTTTITVVGIQGLDGWYVSDVFVTLTAEDDLMGVAQIFYSYDGNTWSPYSAPLHITDEGATKVYYYAVDNVGNQEDPRFQEIAIDTIGPVTSLLIHSPVYWADPYYYVSTVTRFELEAIDSTSGVRLLEYRIDTGSWIPYLEPFTVPDLGIHTLSYGSMDIAGNLETLQSVEVIVNATRLTFLGAFTGVYSDPVSLRAQLIEVATQLPIAGKPILFTVGSQTEYAVTGVDGEAIATIVLCQPVGNYPVSAAFAADGNYLASSDSGIFAVAKETAKVTYTGSTVVSTKASTITLRATVFDDADGFWGDLTEIYLTFRIYTVPLDPSNPILVVGPYRCEITNVAGIGVVLVEIPNLAENGYLVMICFDPGDNQCYQGLPSDLTTIVVYEPTGDFVTGGGWIVDASGNKGSFGFNVRYKKNGLPGGQAIYVYRIGDWQYIVKSTAWLGMAIDQNHSFFEAKCVVQRYNILTGELVWAEGNYQVRVDVWDNGEPGGSDVYQIRVYDKNGLIYYEAGFNPYGFLQGGNIQIHLEKEK